jgi:hypothetical protein
MRVNETKYRTKLCRSNKMTLTSDDYVEKSDGG